MDMRKPYHVFVVAIQRTEHYSQEEERRAIVRCLERAHERGRFRVVSEAPPDQKPFRAFHPCNRNMLEQRRRKA